jgi:hypothetical protein
MPYDTNPDGDDDGLDDRPWWILHTQNPRDRDPGLLTYDDREYLLGKKDVSGGSESQLRQRMRDRIRNALLDFELLLACMEDRDIQTVFDNISKPPWPDGSDGADVYHGSQYALAFIYHGITECTHANFDRLLEEAIQHASGRSRMADEGPHRRFAEASVNIEVEWSVGVIDNDHALEKLREGELLSEKEIGSLVRDGDLEKEDWKRLREPPP